MADFRPVETQREEFRKYLEKGGVMETLTRILISLYEAKERPSQPLDFLKQKLSVTSPDATEVEHLKNEIQSILSQLEALKAENQLLKEENRELKNKIPVQNVTEPISADDGPLN